mmetsp:Transcript_58197/g.123576  ORF Transcript_58197/g.123576 Transcript_58197/m.123576 type:complete len:181 (-) Transcript_58197:30-572(-)
MRVPTSRNRERWNLPRSQKVRLPPASRPTVVYHLRHVNGCDPSHSHLDGHRGGRPSTQGRRSDSYHVFTKWTSHSPSSEEYWEFLAISRNALAPTVAPVGRGRRRLAATIAAAPAAAAEDGGDHHRCHRPRRSEKQEQEQEWERQSSEQAATAALPLFREPPKARFRPCPGRRTRGVVTE